jgi:hypothetical protein
MWATKWQAVTTERTHAQPNGKEEPHGRLNIDDAAPEEQEPRTPQTDHDEPRAGHPPCAWAAQDPQEARELLPPLGRIALLTQPVPPQIFVALFPNFWWQIVPDRAILFTIFMEWRFDHSIFMEWRF